MGPPWLLTPLLLVAFFASRSDGGFDYILIRPSGNQERPCTRCVKRNISHLCRDEPRDGDSRKSKSAADSSVVEEPEQQGPEIESSAHQQQQQQQPTVQQQQPQPQPQQAAGSMPPPPFEGRRSRQSSMSFDDVLGQRASLPNLVRQPPHGRLRGNPLGGGNLSQGGST
ncbi:hypothetical protein IMZ48_07235 [Candidatus Bathyarchaeota archaeon]|nr:hypothetical protein [Candidatus Bathyarchaeota archaeon]